MARPAREPGSGSGRALARRRATAGLAGVGHDDGQAQVGPRMPAGTRCRPELHRVPRPGQAVRRARTHAADEPARRLDQRLALPPLAPGQAAGVVGASSVGNRDPTDGRFTNAILTKAGYAKLVASAPAHVAAVRTLVIDEFGPPSSRGSRDACRAHRRSCRGVGLGSGVDVSGPVDVKDVSEHRQSPDARHRHPSCSSATAGWPMSARSRCAGRCPIGVGGRSARGASPTTSDRCRSPSSQRPDIGPHPHMGLQTVTWLLQGEIAAPGQPGLRAGHPPRAAQSHDRRARGGPRRGDDQRLPRRGSRRTALGCPALFHPARAAGLRAPRRAASRRAPERRSHRPRRRAGRLEVTGASRHRARGRRPRLSGRGHDRSRSTRRSNTPSW